MATLLRVPVENVPSVARQLSRDPTHRFFTRPRDLSSFHGGSTVGRLRSVWPFVAVDRNSLDTPAAVADAPSATLPRCVIFRRLALHPALEIEQTMASSSEILLRRKSSFRGFFDTCLWQISSYLRLFGNILYDVYKFYLRNTYR